MHTRDGIWYVCEWTCVWEGASRRMPQDAASRRERQTHHTIDTWLVCGMGVYGRRAWYGRVPSASSLVARTACGVA